MNLLSTLLTSALITHDHPVCARTLTVLAAVAAAHMLWRLIRRWLIRIVVTAAVLAAAAVQISHSDAFFTHLGSTGPAAGLPAVLHQ